MATKAEFNKLLKRFDKAVTWFDNPKVAEAEKDKYEPEFKKIIHDLAVMVEEFRKQGPMTREEILFGFKGV
jgi:hypothetical protein